ncbi:MAG: fibronectin type III domain-containing protein [Treponema sp.]|nr:fibronectin type III domain-containing protein [Treponema sp.]
MKKVLPLVFLFTALVAIGCKNLVVTDPGSNDPTNNGPSKIELTQSEKEEIFNQLLTDEKKIEIFLSLLTDEKKAEIFNEILQSKHDDATFLSLLTEEEKNLLKLEFESNLSDSKKQEIISAYLTDERKAEIFDEILGIKRSTKTFLSILTSEEEEAIYNKLLTQDEKDKIIAEYLTEDTKTEIFNKIVKDRNYVALLTAEEKTAMEAAAVENAKAEIISDYLDNNTQEIFNSIVAEKHDDNTFVNLLTDSEKAELKVLFEEEGVSGNTKDKIINEYLSDATKTAIATEVLKNTAASFTSYLSSEEIQVLLKNNLSDETKNEIFSALLTQEEKDKIITDYLTDEKKAEIYEEKLSGTKTGIEQAAIEAYVIAANKEEIFAKLMTEDDKKEIFNEMLTQEEKDKIINALSAEKLQALLDGKDVVPPQNVTDLTATNKDKSVLLSWTPSEDEDLLCYEVTYEIATGARAVSFAEGSIIVPAGTNCTLISNLTNGKTYTFVVKSMDRTGNKSEGTKVSCDVKEIYKSISMTTSLSDTDLVIHGLTVNVNAVSDTGKEITKITWKEYNSSVADVTTDTLKNGTDITETKSFFVTENGVYVVACESEDGIRTSHFVNITNSVITTTGNTTVFDGKNNKFITRRNGYPRNNPAAVSKNTFPLDTANIVIKDLTLEGDDGSSSSKMNYNVFNMSCGAEKTPIQSIYVENLKTTGNIEHTTLAAYNFADNAVMTVKNSSFTRNDDDPFIRLSNWTFAKNVTIKLENVDLNYTCPDSEWNGFIIYQTPFTSRADIAKEIEAVKTWHFIFENCTYNGKLINDNHSGNDCLMYSYNTDFDNPETKNNTRFDFPGCDIVINGKKLYNSSEVSEVVKISGSTATVKDIVIKTPKKDSSNGAVLLNAQNIEIDNVLITGAEASPAYNIFEQPCSTSAEKIKTVNVSNLDIDGTNITHNFLNFYNLDDNATITVKDSTFDIKADNNILRLSNLSNAKNVTVTFENIEWKYDETNAENGEWASIILYQSLAKTLDGLKAEIEALNTWNFNFVNCRYNGELVTSNSENLNSFRKLLILYVNNGSKYVIKTKASDWKIEYSDSTLTKAVTESEDTFKISNALLSVPKTEGSNAAILTNKSNIVITNVSLKGSDSKPAYNVFEQPCSTSAEKIKSVEITDLNVTGTNITHNFLNFYNFEDNAEITVKNSNFDIKSDNNILRLSNLSYAENVTVKFENIDWKYDETNAGNGEWAAVVLYQSTSNSIAGIHKEIEALKTWNFVFENCRYNGEVISENPFSMNSFNKLKLFYLFDEVILKNGKATVGSNSYLEPDYWRITYPAEYASLSIRKTDDTTIISDSNITVPAKTASSNAAISVNSRNVIISDILVSGTETEDGKKTYNLFEQPYSVTSEKVKNIEVSNIYVDGRNMTHNALNFYNLDDNATITVKDSNFYLYHNSNALRLSNLSNAKNVTVRFENVDVTYFEENLTSENKEWLGFVLYQGTNEDYESELEAAKTWKFEFVNCSLNYYPMDSNRSEEGFLLCHYWNKTGKTDNDLSASISSVENQY